MRCTIWAGSLPFNRRFLSIDSLNNNTTINEFLNTFYRDLEDRESFLHDLHGGIEYDDGHMFKSQVINLLNDKKKDGRIYLTEIELHKLQMNIEDLTMQFDEYSIFKESHNIIKILVGNDLICAKSYLYKYLPLSVYNSTIAQFGQYTLEAIIVYVLGLLYNCIQESSVVRVVTLIEKLDSTVRTQANIINKKNLVSKTATSSKEGGIKRKRGNKYEIGIRLLEFMIERQLIYIETFIADGKKAVVKEKGKGYLESNLFAVCNFKLSLLPLKLNLPMVCKPKDWELKSDVDKTKPMMLSDMRGGYLSDPTLDIYNRLSLISSRNLSNFNIELHDSKYKELCFILNGLQNQGFKINKIMLEFIKRNRATLEKLGYLMSRKLIHVNLKEAYDYLRISYFKNNAIQKVCGLSFLFKDLATRLQAARYEDSIIRLASAYDDYIFYLPAFMDFRGRIYRSGILHFHERDLAKSLIVFAYNHQEVNNLLENDIVASSAAFKYKKFSLYDEALQWYKDNQSVIQASEESLIRVPVIHFSS
ncbi:probable DNA-directed RNA polymerase [Primulina huaijiensis]|uniref:probable DNA-directed RNA polymerase n=1 Tax=Primulina huaijiensis TaxID=1492673 RepID=UPI003CC75B1C